MEHRRLGWTDISVSRICLGTMTFGEQNDEASSHRLLDQALDLGINFLDTAEMYPAPPSAETYGRTESIVGSWFKARRNRSKVVLATKAIGLSRTGFGYVRDGKARLDRANLVAAVDASLTRLQIDCIDYYQLHWTDRLLEIDAIADGRADAGATPLEETLSVLADLIKTGKLRTVGLSNENAWGTMRFLELAGRQPNLPRMAGIQNRYSLLARTFEIDLAEIALRENVPLLPYSPLCMGVLTGKYLGGRRPAGSRMALFESRFARYVAAPAEHAAAAYVKLAQQHGIDPGQMALAFVYGQPFVASTIIGVTTPAQLSADVAALSVKLSPDLLKGIEDIHRQNPSPCM